MTTSNARFLLGIALPVVTAVIGFGSWLLWRGELAGEIATHYSVDGTADGSSSPTAFFISFGLPLLIGMGLCMVAAAFADRMARPSIAIVAFIGGTFASLASAIFAVTIFTQRGLADWTQARLSVLLVFAVIAIAVAVGSLAAWLASFLGEDDPVPMGGIDAPVMDLSADEHAVWTVSHTLRPIVAVAAAVIIVCLVARLFVLERWLPIAPALLIAAIVLIFASYRLRVDRSGLHVRSTLLPWPSMHLEVDEIRSASILDVRPMEWGGWGYRGSLKLMKQAALVQRAGPGMRLDLEGGRVFVVTTDRPETPVALLNAFVQRRAVSAE